MRSWKVAPVHVSILEGLSDGKSLRKIASSLGLDHSTVIRHTKQLEHRGYITRQVRSNQVFYSILPAGISIMHHPVSGTLTGGSKHAPPPEDIRIRLHRLQIKFDLKNPVKDPAVIRFRDFPSKIVSLEHWQKNIIQFEDFTAILSTKSLIITGIQRYLDMGHDIESQEAEILARIAPFAEQVEERIRRMQPGFRILRREGSGPPDLDTFDLTPLESASCNAVREGRERITDIHDALKENGLDVSIGKLQEVLGHLVERGLLTRVGAPEGFALKRLDRGVLSGKIISRELAFEHHPIAEKAGQMRIDAPDGKPRIIVDSSKGFPELETVHKDTAASDAEQIRVNTEVLATEDLRSHFKDLAMQISITTELARHASVAQDQMDQVISAIGKLVKVVGGMQA